MKFSRALRTALLGAALGTPLLAATDAELAALITKAERGNAIAQYNVGLAFAEGRGTPADPIEAFVWLSIARENGARGRALDSLLPRLTPAQRDAAEELLAVRRAQVRPASSDVTPSEQTSAPPPPPTDNSPLERELAEARADKQQLSSELAAAWKEADELKAQLAQARATPAAAPEAEQLRKERDLITSRLAEVNVTVSSLQTDRERLQKLAAQVQRELSDARELSRAHQERTRLAEMKIEELTRRASLLATDLERANQTIAALQAPRANPELDQAQRDLASLRAELENYRNANTQLTETLGRVANERAAIEREFATAETTVAELTRDVQALRTHVATLEARRAAPAYPDLRPRVSELETSLAQTREQLTAARHAPPAYPDLRPRVTELEEQLATANARPTTPSYPDLRPRVSELETQLAALRNAPPAYPDLREQVARLQTQLTAAESRASAPPPYPDLRPRVTELESQLAALHDAPPAYPDLRSRVAELQDALASARAAAPAYPDLRHRVRDLEAALDEARRTAPAYPDLRERVTELEAQVVALRDAPPAFPDLRPRVAQLERELAAAHSATPPYPDLRTRIAELQDQLASARAAAPAYPDLRARVQELELALTAVRDQTPTYADLRPRVSELESSLAQTREQLTAARNAVPSYPDLRDRVRELETRLAARPAAPGYPDLRERVTQLEAQLAAAEARPTAPAYPDLRPRVDELETSLAATREQLAAAQSRAATSVAASEAAGDPEELARKLAESEDKLATALRGYSLLQRQHRELRDQLTASQHDVTNERDQLRARLTAAEENTLAAQAEVTRLTDSLAALQRSSTQGSSELAQLRALLAQVQGANTTLAQENYQLKTALARDPNAARTTAAVVPASMTATDSPRVSATAAVARTHTVEAGDSLSRLSQRYYGTPGRWQEIYNANRDVLANQNNLRVGMTLRIP